jgi:DNA-binding transcriptional regulator of glucitol operon
MANYHKMMLDITSKYMTAIKKYCAYSTGEALRFLLIYNSKKSLPLWDYMEGRSVFQPFKNKTQIQQILDQHRTTLDELNSKEAATAEADAAAAAVALENVFIPNA